MSTTPRPLPGLGCALETNFIIEKFQRLSLAFQRLIYEGLHENPRSVVYAAAGFALLHLAIDADDQELTAYINDRLKAPFTGWIIIPEDRVPKAASLARYFLEHLKFEDGKFLIEPMGFFLE
jgi:hypothetical protein